MMVKLIGCGGGGGWLASLLARSLGSQDEITLIDGDTFEQSNLDRQVCRMRDMRKNKALVLAEAFKWRAGVSTWPRYFTGSEPDLEARDWLLCAVDNHAARRNVLRACDRVGCRAVIISNEYESAEAYAYLPLWKDTPADPRHYYPELVTSAEGDPLNPPCTGVVVEHHPQLVLANMWSAAAGGWLLRYWSELHGQLTDDEARSMAPVHARCSGGVISYKQVRDYGTNIKTV